MAILGLLVQQPDTINGVKLRLTERLPSGGWSRSIAHGSMASLARQDFVRVSREGAERSLDLYEATPEGVERFREWLSEVAVAPPVLRDALHAKLQFIADEDDLLAVVEAIRGQEDACFDAAEAARRRMNKARRLGRLGPVKGADMESRLLSAMMIEEVAMWGDMGRRLKRFRKDLEGVEDPDERLWGPGDADG
jgi:DNA-binding PadR family transcriptional regulator